MPQKWDGVPLSPHFPDRFSGALPKGKTRAVRRQGRCATGASEAFLKMKADIMKKMSNFASRDNTPS